MEVITLKQKKKLNWKNIIKYLISILVIFVCGFLFKQVHIDYHYYIITPAAEKIDLGIGDNKHLKDRAIMTYLEDLEEQKYLIADFNITKIVKIKPHLTFGKKQYDNQTIMDNISKELYVTIYASKITIGEDIIYVPHFRTFTIINKIEEAANQPKKKEGIVKKNGKKETVIIEEAVNPIDIKQEYVYINLDQIWDDQAIDNYIQEKFDKK